MWHSCGDKNSHFLLRHAWSPRSRLHLWSDLALALLDFPGYLDVFHFFMGMRPTLYHFYAGTSFRTGPYHLLSSFLYAFCLFHRRSKKRNVYLGYFLLSLTINDREGSQGWGGLSTGTRAKGYHAHHSWVGGNKQSSFAFFLDDKYVRWWRKRHLNFFSFALQVFALTKLGKELRSLKEQSTILLPSTCYYVLSSFNGLRHNVWIDERRS